MVGKGKLKKLYVKNFRYLKAKYRATARGTNQFCPLSLLIQLSVPAANPGESGLLWSHSL